MSLSFKYIGFFIAILAMISCNAQTKNNAKMKKEIKNANPLLCDPTEGICTIPGSETGQLVFDQKTEMPIKVIYFTDPICSSCWGIEPQLRKMKQEYGNNIEVEYRMGGLLPDWSYNSGGISKPSDVAHHWDEVSAYYDMPIDGDVWLEDPLHSSYPPSMAFKAAELQSKDKAVLFLRELREMVFLRKKNIAKWENISLAAKNVGLNVGQLETDINQKGKTLLEEDLKLSRDYGVRGFPTMFFINSSGAKETVYGSKPYSTFETAIFKLNATLKKSEYGKSADELFSKYHSLTAKEFSELSGKSRADSEKHLNELTTQGILEKLTTKNGSIWTIKK